MANYRHKQALPALLDIAATLSFDDASNVKENAKIVGRSSSAPAGANNEEEGARDNIDYKALNLALLRSRMDKELFTLFTRRGYRRKVLLPNAFYDRSGSSYIPSTYINGYSYSSYNKGYTRSEEGSKDAKAR